MDRQASLVVDLASPRGASAPRAASFYIPPDQAKALLEESGNGEAALLSSLITPASCLARPPISAFHVGAVGLGASGAIYVGVNLEFARLPLYNSVHAEQFLVANAVHHGERALRWLAVSAAPCGHCRQFFCELAGADDMRITFGSGPDNTYSLEALLPQRFGPADLLPDPSAPLMMQPQNNNVVLSPAADGVVASRSSSAAFQRAAAAALEHARQSYAPYSRCPAGVAIATAGGGCYAGSYLESAAFNPSLPPLQTAIVSAVLDGMPTYAEVVEVVLVELEVGPVQHAPTTRVILEQIAPDARLTVLHAVHAPSSTQA